MQQQKWEEKFQLAAQEIESLKHTGGMQIQQIRAENVELKRRGTDLEAALREREGMIASMQTEHSKFTEHLAQMEQEYTRLEEENQGLRRQRNEQSETMKMLEDQAAELRRMCETESSRATELEQAVTTWKERFEEKESHRQHLEQALDEGRREIGERDGSLNQLMGESKKYQENLDEYEQELTQMQEYIQAVEAENQTLRDKLVQEGEKYEALLHEAREATSKRSEVESDATSAIKQMEEQFMQQKAQFEAVVQQEMDQMKLENRELVSKLQGLDGINKSQAAEINRLAENLREAEKQFQKQGHDAEQMKRQNHELSVKLQSLEDANKSQGAEINRLMANLREAEAQFHQQRTQHESERVQQLSNELEQIHKECERLTQVIAQKDAVHAETLDKQKSEYESKHNDFVARVESQFQQFSEENDQLRATLEEKEKKFQLESNQIISEKEEEISKWIAEYDKVENKLHEFDRANESLNHELDKCLQELELKKKENAEMSDQIEQYLAPNNERTKEVELLHSERLRLEEQNHELQQQIQATRQEADAKLEEAHQIQLRASEQEGAHRHEVRSLYLEKEDTNRKLLALGSERSAIEFQLKSMASEKNILLEKVNQLEQEKRGLEARLEDVMRQATREMEAQQQNAVLVSEDIRVQLQNATSQLAQREEQLRQGHQQMQSLGREIGALREKNQQFEDEARTMRSQGMQLNAQLETALKEKAELESKVRLQNTTSSLASQRASQRVIEAEFSRKFDDLKAEADQRVNEEAANAKRVQDTLESRLSAQERQFRDETEDLEQARTDLAQQVELLTHSCERLEAELKALKIDRENQEKVIQDLDHTIDMLEREKSAQSHAASDTQHVEHAHRELQQMHEQFKKDVMAQLKEKADLVSELEDDNAELQAKLDRQKEMTRHLMDRANAEKQEHTDEVVGKSRLLRDHQDKTAALEKRVRELEREMQVQGESRAAKDQSVMHEKLQLERELRSMQKQYDEAVQENTGIRAELDRKTAEIENMQREIQQNTAEMEIARNALEAAEQQLNRKLEEFGEDLEDREHELYQKEMELQQVSNSARQTQAELSRTIDELKHKVSDLQAELEHARRPRSADKSNSFDQQDAVVESRLRALQKRCEELQAREQSLSGQVAQLEDEKAAVVDRFTRELRRLNVDLGRNQSDRGDLHLDDALHEYLAEVTELIRSFQDREGRQDSLIHRKERQINELKERLAKAERESSATPRGSSTTPRKSAGTPQSVRSANDDEVQRQIDEMNDKVAALAIENRQLRDMNARKRLDGRDPSDQTAVLRELEAKYSQLKTRVQDLKSENAKLKQNRLTKADAKTFVTEIEKLTAEVMEKDLQLQAHRRRETKLRASSASANANANANATGNGAAASTGSLPERSRDLRALLQQKEEKIMVLNDHLTELMKQSVRLQHENERYVVRYGALADQHHSPTTASSNTTASDSSRRGTRRSVRPPRPPTAPFVST